MRVTRINGMSIFQEKALILKYVPALKLRKMNKFERMLLAVEKGGFFFFL